MCIRDSRGRVLHRVAHFPARRAEQEGEGSTRHDVDIDRNNGMTLPTRRSIAVLGLTVAAVQARAQTKEIDGPPRPVAPEVITRASSGQATVRAIKLTSPLKLDGRLDEEVYAREKPFGGLIQVTPNYMELMSERSDVWITYDAEFIYVTCSAGTPRRRASGSPTSCVAIRTACGRTTTSA